MSDVVLTDQVVWLALGIIATCLLHAVLRYLKQFSARLVAPQEPGRAEPHCTPPLRPLRFQARPTAPFRAVSDAPSR